MEQASVPMFEAGVTEIKGQQNPTGRSFYEEAFTGETAVGAKKGNRSAFEPREEGPQPFTVRAR